jgi:hypothetical protein
LRKALCRRDVLEDLASDVIGGGFLNPCLSIGSFLLGGAFQFLS